MLEINARNMMADSKFFESYSRWNDKLARYETWSESVDRVMDMHLQYYDDKIKENPSVLDYISEATAGYKSKMAIGAQRALQFGGEQLLSNPMRLYNCTSTYVDRPEVFGEILHTLLCGAGVGFSVQKHHISKLPKIQNRTKQAKIFVVEDSIEGWASSLDVLMSSYFVGGGKHPEYEGRRVYFDLSLIRPKGAFISGGFKAPGPEPLRKALDKIEYLLQGLIFKDTYKLDSINAYDIIMHSADAVLAGGVRRSATICLFSVDDEKMLSAKTGNWFTDNPQRGRSNNSAVILRSTSTYEQFANIMKYTRDFGEPGFIFVDDLDYLYNPCVEIAMWGYLDDEKKQSGFQGCNLSEINGSKCSTAEEFYAACRVAAILGTLQAGYTKFKFLSDTSRAIFEREALIGVSITGWMSNPQVFFNDEILETGAAIVKQINKELSALIGINQAARTTCGKPAGNASVLLETPSGIHGEPAKRYIRHVQMNKESEVAQLIKQINPYMVEESVWSSAKTDYCIAYPIIPKSTSVFNSDLKDIAFLEKVKFAQQHWVEAGTNVDLCVHPGLRHNISNTVIVGQDKWDIVTQYLYDNKQFFTGVSFIADTGDKDYHQAPNTAVLSEDEVVEKYGIGAVFAAGLIVDHVKGFSSLWEAISVAVQTTDPANQEVADNRADWVRRFKKFAKNYFENDLKKTEYCLKDVYLLHKWYKICQNFKEIDFVAEVTAKKFTDIDTMGSAACIGGACEI